MENDSRDGAPPGRSERARTATLEAALALAAELPYPQVTIEAIAARAGVGKATIYRRWPHRGALMVDAVAHRNDRAATAGGAVPDTGDLAADLAVVLRSVVDELARPEWDALLRALCVEALVDTATRARVLDLVVAPQIALFAERFATARSAGRIDDAVGDTEAFELVVAPVFHRWQLRTGPLDHAYADAVARRACRAMAP
ncbi:TetR/AcrR family transcriptional regulator [Pseudonocardia spirodelae]|uniref:TetR/AcrR family transcriptional regulator C-terminal ligand-binding domain-containing protein n=1 Tax=Pseudonocardia spirodelae TaxID=3133431 RepID=A0ABU8TBI7_9PSEU